MVATTQPYRTRAGGNPLSASPFCRRGLEGQRSKQSWRQREKEGEKSAGEKNHPPPASSPQQHGAKAFVSSSPFNKDLPRSLQGIRAVFGGTISFCVAFSRLFTRERGTVSLQHNPCATFSLSHPLLDEARVKRNTPLFSPPLLSSSFCPTVECRTTGTKPENMEGDVS